MVIQVFLLDESFVFSLHFFEIKNAVFLTKEELLFL